MTIRTCGICGRDVSEPDRDVRFRLRGLVLADAALEQAAGTWLSHGGALSSVMMQIPSFGAFIRALLPIGQAGGHTLSYRVWVGFHPDDLQRASAVWWEPACTDLHLDGRLANAVQPWGCLPPRSGW